MKVRMGEIGTLTITHKHPAPKNGWILCTGGVVPDGYPELSEMLEGKLPNVTVPDIRFKAYICGGWTVDVSVVGEAIVGEGKVS